MKVRAFINGIRAIMKETPQSSISLLPSEDAIRN